MNCTASTTFFTMVKSHILASKLAEIMNINLFKRQREKKITQRFT